MGSSLKGKNLHSQRSKLFPLKGLTPIEKGGKVTELSPLKLL